MLIICRGVKVPQIDRVDGAPGDPWRTVAEFLNVDEWTVAEFLKVDKWTVAEFLNVDGWTSALRDAVKSPKVDEVLRKAQETSPAIELPETKIASPWREAVKTPEVDEVLHVTSHYTCHTLAAYRLCLFLRLSLVLRGQASALMEDGVVGGVAMAVKPVPPSQCSLVVWAITGGLVKAFWDPVQKRGAVARVAGERIRQFACFTRISG
jgi:hypothetical protein